MAVFNKKLNNVLCRFIKFCKLFFTYLGIFAFALFLLSFTDLPYFAYQWLGVSNVKKISNPDLIVVLGGSGMPSPDGLIRTYYAVEAAIKYNRPDIIIALPYNEKKSLRQLDLMAHELIVKGIDSARIKYEPLGFNTHSQALNIASRYAAKKEQLSVLLITSPEHMYRSVGTFKKAGFKFVSGLPTFEKPIDEDRVKDKGKAKDARIKSLSLRYNMWSYLNYELLIMREYCAISYYKLKGWI